MAVFSALFERQLVLALGNRSLASELTAVFNVATAGTAEASKALVLDSSKGIATITSATITTLTATTVALSAGSITTDTSTGLTIAANNTQKVGLFGATPVVQPSGTAELVGFTGNAATNANAVNFAANGNTGSKSYTLGDVVKALKNLGALAAS